MSGISPRERIGAGFAFMSEAVSGPVASPYPHNEIAHPDHDLKV